LESLEQAADGLGAVLPVEVFDAIVRWRSVMRPRSASRSSAVLLRIVPWSNAARRAGSVSPASAKPASV